MTKTKIKKSDELWAITEEGFEARIAANNGVGTTVAHGVKSDERNKPSYYNDGMVSIVNVSGDLVKAAEWSGDTAYSDIEKSVVAAMSDPNTSAVLLNIASPGGMVSGCPELADYIAEANSTKPVYAYADGLMASAAYWLGSGATEVAASKTAQVGSIGVLAAHTDISKMLENAGIKVSFITSGKYKAIGNFAEPLSKEGREYIQARIDKVYSMFVGDVARNRGLSPGSAEKWADGQIFFAEDALKAGLVDRVCGIEAFIQHIKGAHPMKMEDVKAQHPDVYDAIYESGVKSIRGTADAEKKSAVEAAVADRTTEIMALVGVVAGEETAAKLTKMVDAGVSAKQLEAIKSAGLLGGKTDSGATSRQDILNAIAGNTNAPVGSTEPNVQADKPAKFEALVEDYMRANNCKEGKAKLEVGAKHPELREAWLKSKQAA